MEVTSLFSNVSPTETVDYILKCMKYRQLDIEIPMCFLKNDFDLHTEYSLLVQRMYV